MSEESQTIDATGLLGDVAGAERAYLIVDDGGGERTRVVDLPDGEELSFGRSRSATIVVDSEKVSRLHARVLRRGATITVEDLGAATARGSTASGSRRRGGW
jgi:pSer/pThr/pTyr-binding forkhead associated (FHA) protein